MELVVTHCHIHFADYELDPESVIRDAIESGVTRMVCVGCTLADSKLGVDLAKRHSSLWASIGVHPHEAKYYVDNHKALQELRQLASESKVVAIGEIGLDYFYNHSDKQSQLELFRFQLTLATEHDLPVIFHVRDPKTHSSSEIGEAFSDFFAVLSDFKGIRGVVHSFTAGSRTLDKCINKGLYIGLNGIMTFTKDQKQLKMAKKVPLDRLVLETDAPFLTPVPYRGKICQPKHVASTAEFLASLRGETLEYMATASTANALKLFNLK
jgi:TatD DNase family protein